MLMNTMKVTTMLAALLAAAVLGTGCFVQAQPEAEATAEAVSAQSSTPPQDPGPVATDPPGDGDFPLEGPLADCGRWCEAFGCSGASVSGTTCTCSGCPDSD